MQRPFFYFILLLILLSTTFTQKAYANHIAGGDIYYVHVDDSTYDIFARIYWDCKNDGMFLPPPTTFPLCISNSCTGSTVSINMSQENIAAENSYCPGFATTCTSTTSPYLGFKQTTYKYRFTTPFRCSTWKFAVYYDHRIGFGNCGTVQYYYVATEYNNTGSYRINSSPKSNSIGNFVVANGQPFTYNNDVTDPDGDSITTEVVWPLLLSPLNCNGTATPVSCATTSPPFSLPNNPFQTNNTFKCDTTSGGITFTPGNLSVNVFAVRLKEYRAGVQIGYTTKEIALFVFNSSSSASYKITSTSGCKDSLGTIYACPGQPISFTAKICSSQQGSIYLVSDNHTRTIPSATVSYSNQGKDTVLSTFSWVTPMSANKYNLVYTIRDSSCTSPGAIIYKSVTIPVVVLQTPSAYPDTTVCNGQTLTLRAAGGSNYLWSVVSGTLGSLSCSTCINPVASPTTTTKYALKSSIASCNNYYDTITVNVVSSMTPSIAITANPAGTIQFGTNVSFAATGNGCGNPTYIWKVNGVTVGTGLSYNSKTLHNNDKVTCDLQCADNCANPNKVTSAAINMSVGINELETKNVFYVVPNPNNGYFTLQGKVIDNQPISVEITNMVGQIVYKGRLTPANGYINNEIKLDVLNGVYILRAGNFTALLTIKN
ncbi:MAG: T9SS type A sorting domain-containing protein [Bacteroidetes bacterium]|nr:T9SS type A sorting domain-containing protein [Bacteroidota bacterium]